MLENGLKQGQEARRGAHNLWRRLLLKASPAGKEVIRRRLTPQLDSAARVNMNRAPARTTVAPDFSYDAVDIYLVWLAHECPDLSFGHTYGQPAAPVVAYPPRTNLCGRFRRSGLDLRWWIRR